MAGLLPASLPKGFIDKKNAGIVKIRIKKDTGLKNRKISKKIMTNLKIEYEPSIVS